MRISDWSSDVCSSDLVRVQQLAGLRVAMRVVAAIDLAETGVDAIGRRVGERTVQPRAGLGAGGIALRRAGDVERPRPGDQAPAQPGAAPLHRSEERRVANKSVSTSRSRGSPSHTKKKK